MKRTELLLRLLLTVPAMNLFVIAAAEIPCDLNGSGRVNYEDFACLSGSWGLQLSWGPDGLPRQMLGHWRMDGNTEDTMGLYGGTVYGSPDWLPKVAAVVGSGAVALNGGDYIAVESPPLPGTPGSFTLDLYVKTTLRSDGQVLLGRGYPGWEFGIEAGTGRLYLSCPGLEGTNSLIGLTNMADNLWHHVSGVYDHLQQKMFLYLDGAVEGEASAWGGVFSTDPAFWIGGNPNDPSCRDWFYGSLDNIRVFNYAMTCPELYGSKVLQVDGTRGLDSNSGEGRQSALKTIQAAIDLANPGDLILVWPGVYEESLFFSGKAVTVRSISEAAELRAPGEIAVTFMYGEQQDSVLENFIIRDCYNAVFVYASSPTLRNVTIVNNQFGIDCWANSVPVVENSILWDNAQGDITYQAFVPEVRYCCVQRGAAGTGNITLDPLFVDPNGGDYHLQSEYGRYVSDGTTPRRPKPENWVQDAVTSPCIDGGRASDNPMNETMPNGGRINMGAYGGTAFASLSPWPLAGDVDWNGRTGIEDLCLLSESWLLETELNPE